jgi:hypothetical protein
LAKRMNHIDFPSQRYAKIGMTLFDYNGGVWTHWFLAKKFVASERTY